ncbi:hypothetical protein MAXJ12_24772 [Mesorhizobium alhagi CCNWXJ12-2]|uniref:Uncharacterized protein n=2 Tax=Allomesorhizobium alhagi TaxID=475067 RepID=H0HXQ5_9HYPH|nr:hypothetical protein MAXJ12_24772 [Mesorhizobium alhagi CCNWXJ12-2]
MLLPGRLSLDHRKRVVTKPSQEVQTEFLRLEYTDPKTIIPDLYVRALEYDLFVEVAVTHFSDEAKVRRLREHRTPAVEVDLSRLSYDLTREAIADAVLRTAPRWWLYHPGIDVAETNRREDEERWRAAQDERRVGAAAKHQKRVVELISAYWEASNALAEESSQISRLEELQATGFAEHVGIEVAGFACFAVPPEVWQAIILTEVFHDRCLGNGVCKAVPITQHLEKAGLIRQQFRRVYAGLADDAAMIEPDFAPPWKAVDAYLKHLARAGVLVQHDNGMVLARQFAEPWTTRTLAEKQRTAAMHAAMQAVEWILAELPAEERGNATSESWLDSVHTESGMKYRAALQSGIEAPKISAEINAAVAMLEKRGPLPYGTVGLPIEGAIQRRKVQMAKQAGELRKKHIQEAERLRHSRRERLCIDAEEQLSGSGLDAFLNTTRDELNRMTPLEAAEDSEPGLNRARDLLSVLVRQLAREGDAAAERQHYQDKIIAEAKRRLASEHSEAFLNARDDDLGRMTPLMFVKDDSTYRKALAKLSEWDREFGHLSR